MNVFEQCLLIHYLMSQGGDDNKKRAKELAEAIRDRNIPPSIDSMNRIYDVVLNMNSLNSKPSGMEDFMEQMKKEKNALLYQKERQHSDYEDYAEKERNVEL